MPAGGLCSLTGDSEQIHRIGISMKDDQDWRIMQEGLIDSILDSYSVVIKGKSSVALGLGILCNGQRLPHFDEFL